MAIYFVRPSYLKFLQDIDGNINLMHNKDKRPFVLVNAKIKKVEASVLVPLSMATENRLKKERRYKESREEGVRSVSMSTVIYEEGTRKALSIARHNWVIPYNLHAVEKLELNELFEGNHKEQLSKILQALRADSTGKPSETMKQIELNTQSTIDIFDEWKKDPTCASHPSKHDYPNIAKVNRRAKNYTVPTDEIFKPMDLSKWNDEQSTDDETNKEQPKEKPTLLARKVEPTLSFARVAKNDDLEEYEKQQLQQKNANSYAAAVAKNLPDITKSTQPKANAGEENQEKEVQPLPSTSENVPASSGGADTYVGSRRKPLSKVKFTDLSSKSAITFAQAASTTTGGTLSSSQSAPPSSKKSSTQTAPSFAQIVSKSKTKP
ncbi:MAG: hypothetical protein ACRC9R_10400 [Enterovibrio sp.]